MVKHKLKKNYLHFSILWWIQSTKERKESKKNRRGLKQVDRSIHLFSRLLDHSSSQAEMLQQPISKKKRHFNYFPRSARQWHFLTWNPPKNVLSLQCIEIIFVHRFSIFCINYIIASLWHLLQNNKGAAVSQETLNDNDQMMKSRHK